MTPDHSDIPKRKTPSDTFERVQDPRKRPCLTQENLCVKVSQQERHISDLESRLAEVIEQSNTKQHCHETEITTVRNLLKYFMERVDEGEESIKNLENDLETVEKLLQATRSAYDSKNREAMAAADTIRNVTEKNKEYERQHLHLDVKLQEYRLYVAQVKRTYKEKLLDMSEKVSRSQTTSLSTGNCQICST